MLATHPPHTGFARAYTEGAIAAAGSWIAWLILLTPLILIALSVFAWKHRHIVRARASYLKGMSRIDLDNYDHDSDPSFLRSSWLADYQRKHGSLDGYDAEREADRRYHPFREGVSAAWPPTLIVGFLLVAIIWIVAADRSLADRNLQHKTVEQHIETIWELTYPADDLQDARRASVEIRKLSAHQEALRDGVRPSDMSPVEWLRLQHHWAQQDETQRLAELFERVHCLADHEWQHENGLHLRDCEPFTLTR